MNILITAPRHTDISFATMNRIKDIVMRKGPANIFSTYETWDSIPDATNLPKSWAIEMVGDGRLDMLIVVGYDRAMSVIDAAETAGIDVVLFKEA